MKIACIYWGTSSVGGIATSLNNLRNAALRFGDQFDIMHSKNWKSKSPQLFNKRQWIRGGDTRIWVDGEIPQTISAARWLEENYDAVFFGFICPHETKAYPTPNFLALYDTKLPMVARVSDGYWEEYKHWAVPLLAKLKAVVCPLESYATPLRQAGAKNVIISPFSFVPQLGKITPKDSQPLLVWPNQWKNIKGITEFLGVVPSIDPRVNIEMYSNGIRYYQVRTEEVWKQAIDKDLFQGFNGSGRATFFGNLDRADIFKAYQRSWFTVNLQGMKTKKDTYRTGSYNNTEVEALFYGSCPILHSSTLQTKLPKDVYISVNSADEIPPVIKQALKEKFALCPKRQKKAKEFVLDTHLATHRYQDIRRLF